MRRIFLAIAHKSEKKIYIHSLKCGILLHAALHFESGRVLSALLQSFAISLRIRNIAFSLHERVVFSFVYGCV